MKWINCKDELPVEREQVIAYFSDGERRISWWFKWGNAEPIWNPGIAAMGKVTHWQPLPAPPEGKS